MAYMVGRSLLSSGLFVRRIEDREPVERPSDAPTGLGQVGQEVRQARFLRNSPDLRGSPCREQGRKFAHLVADELVEKAPDPVI